jgi:hypothetical protein
MKLYNIPCLNYLLGGMDVFLTQHEVAEFQPLNNRLPERQILRQHSLRAFLVPPTVAPPDGLLESKLIQSPPELATVYTQVIDSGKIPAELSPNPEDAVGQLIDFVLIPP